MRTVTFNPNNTSIALRNIAKERGNLRVEFTHGNEVQFERLGNGHRVRWIRCDSSTTYLYYLSSSTEDLSEEENGLLCAAMMKLRITSVMVGHNDVVILGAPMVNVIVEQPIIIEVEPEPVRHASNWDRAREFGVSGHRTKQQSKPVEPVRMPTTKGGWIAFGVIAAITVVATAVAAAAADQ